MGEIDFGLSLRRLDDVALAARQAEDLGYQFVTAGEHVFFHGPIGNSLISLAAAAGATEHIKLMSTIPLVPLDPAALPATQITARAVGPGGRFPRGVGVGGEFAPEFEACGVSLKERGSRTDEALEVLTRLWTEDEVYFDGRFTRLSGVTLAPQPVQKPHPPIWVAGRREAAMKRSARFGNGWLPYMYTPEMLAESLETIARYRADFGRSDPVSAGIFLFFAVSEERDRGLEMATAQLSVQYNQDFSRLVGKYALAGNPEDCITRLREYADAGASTVILASACPSSYLQENQRLLATEVLPAFRT